MTSLMRSFRQVMAFARKELVDVLRQPRLLVTPVLGPFLVMAAFGVGYDDTPRRMRTVFVAGSADSVLLEQVDEYADRLAAFVEVSGTTTDLPAARRRLAEGEIDLVVVFPDDPVALVAAGERADIEVIHTRLDPIERTAIVFAADLAVGEINAAILAQILGEAQQQVGDALAEVRQRSTDVRLNELADEIDDETSRVLGLDPAVVTQPFASEVQLAVETVPDVVDWYAPAAVVLIIQQFGVAFGSLTFVRERQLGVVDVFRVAPVGAREALIGKYVAHLVLGAAVAAVLTMLVVVVLGTPLMGRPLDVVLVMGLTLIASIGLGLVISLVSSSDAQAVQYTMIVLLASLFFSGFFLAASQMEGPARWIGWTLPATFGMSMLREVMLRGTSPDPWVLSGAIVYASIAFAVALAGARRRMGSA